MGIKEHRNGNKNINSSINIHNGQQQKQRINSKNRAIQKVAERGAVNLMIHPVRDSRATENSG